MKSDQSVAGRDDSTTVQHSGESKDKGESGQGSHAILRIGTLRDVRVEWAVAFPAHHVHCQDCSNQRPCPCTGEEADGDAGADFGLDTDCRDGSFFKVPS